MRFSNCFLFYLLDAEASKGGVGFKKYSFFRQPLMAIIFVKFFWLLFFHMLSSLRELSLNQVPVTVIVRHFNVVKIHANGCCYYLLLLHAYVKYPSSSHNNQDKIKLKSREREIKKKRKITLIYALLMYF